MTAQNPQSLTQPVLDLTRELIRIPSVTPDDGGCMDLLSYRLKDLGFNSERIDCGQVSNLWLTHGEGGPVFAFLGHTDVVPTGPVDQWTSPPFHPTERDGYLYGRGAADMKSGVAAMTVALEQYVQAHPDHPGTVGLLLTSDEEGPSVDGIRHVIKVFNERGTRIDYCVVGEPSSQDQLGDRMRVGRRGSLKGEIQVHGTQGHTAYPHKADNPIHRFAPALAALTAETWDEGDNNFPPTTFQISNLNAGTGATNVIPGHLDCVFNFRYGTATPRAEIERRVREILDTHGLRSHGLRYDLDWDETGGPFVTEEGVLRTAAMNVIEAITGVKPEGDTGGGTSDGRFVAPGGAQIIEFGPVNESIHKLDEHVRIDALGPLAACYQGILARVLLK